jgi:NADH-quinone oxidoreductase subunit G
MSETVTLTIDGKSVTVPKGTNVLEAARQLGNDISAFCYHPGLKVVAQCRQCLVSIEKNPKLQPSCQQVVADGMVVHTTDPQSTLARQQQLEFTLVNHPIDCPICDKAGECTLQRLYFDHDNENSRIDTP